jgi:hypothetical protein
MAQFIRVFTNISPNPCWRIVHLPCRNANPLQTAINPWQRNDRLGQTNGIRDKQPFAHDELAITCDRSMLIRGGWLSARAGWLFVGGGWAFLRHVRASFRDGLIFLFNKFLIVKQ